MMNSDTATEPTPVRVDYDTVTDELYVELARPATNSDELDVGELERGFYVLFDRTQPGELVAVHVFGIDFAQTRQRRSVLRDLLGPTLSKAVDEQIATRAVTRGTAELPMPEFEMLRTLRWPHVHEQIREQLGDPFRSRILKRDAFDGLLDRLKNTLRDLSQELGFPVVVPALTGVRSGTTEGSPEPSHLNFGIPVDLADAAGVEPHCYGVLRGTELTLVLNPTKDEPERQALYVSAPGGSPVVFSPRGYELSASLDFIQVDEPDDVRLSLRFSLRTDTSQGS